MVQGGRVQRISLIRIRKLPDANSQNCRIYIHENIIGMYRDRDYSHRCRDTGF